MIFLDGITRQLFITFNFGFTCCVVLISAQLCSFFYIEYPKKAEQAKKVISDSPSFIGVFGWKTGKVGQLTREFEERVKRACELAMQYKCPIACADVNYEGSDLQHCESVEKYIRLKQTSINLFLPGSYNSQIDPARNTVQEIDSFMNFSEKLGQKGNFIVVCGKYQAERTQIYAIFRHNIWLNFVLSKDCLSHKERGAELFKLFCTEANPSWFSIVAWIAQFFVDRTRLNK